MRNSLDLLNEATDAPSVAEAPAIHAALEREPYGPGSFSAYNALSRALVKANHFGEAERRWQDALAIGARTRRIMLREQGKALVERQDYEGAAAKLRAALELEPDDEGSYRAYNYLAQALVRANRFEEAARRWQEALAIGEPAQSETRRIVLRAWGGALVKRQDYEGAAAKLRAALELEPDDVRSYSAYIDLARALVRANRFEEAARRWQEALAIGEQAQSETRRIVLRTWGGALVERQDYEGGGCEAPCGARARAG